MKHNLKISVSKQAKDDAIVSCRSIGVRERLMRFFLGEKKQVTILVPGDSVKEVAISEAKGGEADEQDDAADRR